MNKGYLAPDTERLHKFAFSSRIVIKPMPKKPPPSSFERFADSFAWKLVSLLLIALLTVVTTFVSFYVFRYVPTQIDNRINARLETQSNTSAQVEVIKNDVASIQGSIRELKGQLSNDVSRLDQKLDSYIIGIARSRPKTHHALRSAVSVRRDDLAKSLPAARELLQRASEEGTVLDYGQIREVARITIPRFRREPKGTDIRQDLLNTLVQLAEYKTFVDGTHYSPHGSEINSQEVNIGGIPRRDVSFVNCTIRYRGGDIILENVQFINCKFLIVDEPDGEKFLASLLLSSKPTINLGTFHSHPSGS